MCDFISVETMLTCRSIICEKHQKDKVSLMNRTIHYQIDSVTERQTIRGFLKSKGFSSQNLIQLKKRADGILLNGEPAYVIHPVAPGDHLTIQIREDQISEKIPPVNLPLHIIYEDKDLMILDKPADMPIHPSMNNYETSLANALAWYFASTEEAFVFRCVNRLDRDTTGLTIIAKHGISAGILSTAASERRISREYLAVVEGIGLPHTGTVDVPLGRKPDSAIERMADYENGERAVTHFRVLSEKNNCSLLSLHLETGRTHQIRVHMKHIGHPLIGDFLYNPNCRRMKRQALHSCRLTFTHPITGEIMSFTSPLPEDMKKGFLTPV